MKVQRKPKTDRQYTVRSVPERLDRELRKRAKQEDKSLNTLILEILNQATTPEAQKHHDLDEFAGTWVEDPAFDEAIKDFEQIDEEMWK